MAHNVYHVCSPLCALLLLLLQYLTLPLPSENLTMLHTHIHMHLDTHLFTHIIPISSSHLHHSIHLLTHLITSHSHILTSNPCTHLVTSLLLPPLSSSAGWGCRGQPCSGREGPADGAGFKRQRPSKQGRVCVQPARLYRQCPAGTGQLRSCNSELPGRSQNHPTVVRACR